MSRGVFLCLFLRLLLQGSEVALDKVALLLNLILEIVELAFAVLDHGGDIGQAHGAEDGDNEGSEGDKNFKHEQYPFSSRLGSAGDYLMVRGTDGERD